MDPTENIKTNKFSPEIIGLKGLCADSNVVSGDSIIPLN